jgi:hypothetical protein
MGGMQRPGKPNPYRLLVGGGAITWLVAGAPTVAAWASGRVLQDARAVGWGAAYAAFGIAFALATVEGHLSDRARLVALGAQTLAALVLVPLGFGFEGALFCVVAGQAPMLASRRVALGWVLAQIVATLAVELYAFGPRRGVYLSGVWRKLLDPLSPPIPRCLAMRALNSRSLDGARRRFPDGYRCASNLREDLMTAGCTREALHVAKNDPMRARMKLDGTASWARSSARTRSTLLDAAVFRGALSPVAILRTTVGDHDSARFGRWPSAWRVAQRVRSHERV